MPAPEGLRSAALPSPVPGDTRQRILDAAQSAILAKGFAASSIEEIIAAVGITMSGFFCHFADKGELAQALLERYLDRERVLFDGIFARADELSEDPLHGPLIALKMFEEVLDDGASCCRKCSMIPGRCRARSDSIASLSARPSLAFQDNPEQRVQSKRPACDGEPFSWNVV